MTTSCRGLYKIKEKDYNTEGSLQATDLFKYQHSFIFIHLADEVVQINNMLFNNELNSISGMIVPTNEYELSRYNRANKSGMALTRNKRDGKVNTEQVHFFVSSYVKSTDNEITFTKDQVLETHVVQHAPGSGFGGSAVITAVAFAGFLLIACNCPHIYTDNDISTPPIGAFVGAVSKTLESSDYIVLPKSREKENGLMIVNEIEGEQQFINSIEIKRVSHPSSTQLVTDQEGSIHILQSESKQLNSGNEETMYKSDNSVMGFTRLNDKDLAEHILEYESASPISNAKLHLSVKNSMWSKHVLNEWYGLFGEKLNEHQAKMDTKSKEELLDWRIRQGMMLSIYIKAGEEWVYQSSVDVLGNTTFRDVVIPLNKIPPTNKLEIKLEAGYGLWEVDYARLDTSDLATNNSENLHNISYKLNREKFDDKSLSGADSEYLKLVNGDTLHIDYSPLIAENVDHMFTDILVLSGYYHRDMPQDGKLQRRKLVGFKRDGEMSRFSYHLLNEISKSLSANK